MVVAMALVAMAAVAVAMAAVAMAAVEAAVEAAPIRRVGATPTMPGSSRSFQATSPPTTCIFAHFPAPDF
jgi:hypothetical protein